jgi:hypothetical protein
VAWGRDEAGGVWFALSPKVGARLSPDEVPAAYRSFFAARPSFLAAISKPFLRRISAAFFKSPLDSSSAVLQCAMLP